MDMQPELIAEKLAKETKVLEWLLLRLRKGRFDENQLYAGELLSMMLISSKEAVKAVDEKGGLKKLIRCVAAYRKKDPSSLDEVELVENMFNALCSILSTGAAAKLKFASADGIQLMVTMIRKKRYTQTAALKILNYAVSDCVANAEKFLDVGGLKALFAAFMGRGKMSKKQKKRREESEEHVLSGIVQLFLSLSDVRYLRLLNKFQENGYEKIERLVELHEKYYCRLEDFEREYQRNRGPSSSEEDPEMRYFRRIDDGGLFTLQMCALITALISSAGDEGIRTRVVQLLNQQDSSLSVIKETLVEYAENVGTAGDAKGGGKKMKTILNNVILMLEASEEKTAGAPPGGGESKANGGGSSKSEA